MTMMRTIEILVYQRTWLRLFSERLPVENVSKLFIILK